MGHSIGAKIGQCGADQKNDQQFFEKEGKKFFIQFIVFSSEKSTY